MLDFEPFYVVSKQSKIGYLKTNVNLLPFDDCSMFWTNLAKFGLRPFVLAHPSIWAIKQRKPSLINHQQFSRTAHCRLSWNMAGLCSMGPRRLRDFENELSVKSKMADNGSGCKNNLDFPPTIALPHYRLALPQLLFQNGARHVKCETVAAVSTMNVLSYTNLV